MVRGKEKGSNSGIKVEGLVQIQILQQSLF